MKILLSELRSAIRQILSEVRVIADKSEGASRYRVFSLVTSQGNSVGKLIIVPITLEKYGKNGIDGLLDSMGLKDQYEGGPYYNAMTPIVIDVEKQVIDLGDAVKYNNYKNRRPGAKGSKSRSYVIPHGGTVGDQLLTLQKTLKALMKHDKRIQPSFNVVGNPNYEGQTISDVLKLQDEGNAIAQGRTSEPIVMYHGTSNKRWETIKEKGLRPGNAPFVYVDLVEGYSEFNIYLTTSIEVAENYATRAAVDDRSKAVVLKVIVRDLTKFTFDEDGANWLKIESPGPPWTKNTQKGEEMEIHFRHTYVNPDGSKNRWQDWPNANKIWAAFQQKMIKNLHSANTIGYRGAISKNDVSVYETYKPSSMAFDPDDAEFDDARAETFATLQKGNGSSPTKVAKSEPSAAGKTYKIYGKKGSSPAHTRFKGKVYGAKQGTTFKAGEQSRVSPEGDKLRVSKVDSDHSQVWDPEAE